MQGIWPEGADGTDVNAVCRSHDKKVLATGDDFGLVKLFNFPCVEKGSRAVECRGHSSHVTNVRFLAGDKVLVSLGGEDRGIFLWEHEADEEDEAVELEQVGVEVAEAEAEAEEEEEEEEEKKDENKDESSNSFEFTERGGGDEFMAIKPWLGAIKAPTNPAKDRLDVFNSNLAESLKALSTAHEEMEQYHSNKSVPPKLLEDLPNRIAEVKKNVNR